MRFGKYIVGLWAGAGALGGLLACLFVYGATGKLIVPTTSGIKLLTSQQAAEQLSAWVASWEEEHEQNV